MYDPPVRWNRDLTGFMPGLAKSWEFSPDGKTVTFYFRKGLKWSDGHPFTTDDLRFWWEDLAKNEDYQVIMPPWWAYNEDGTLMEVKYIDDYTISFTFKEPHWIMPYILGGRGPWEWEPMKRPKHYLKQFHPKYNPEMQNYDTFTDKDKWWQNPDYPTLCAWHVVKYVPGKRVVFERNPYYWKIDTAGNQLPYIDYIEGEYVADEEVRVLKILAGDYEAVFYGLEDPRLLPLLKEREKAGDYRIIIWPGNNGAWPGVVVNQTYNVEKTKDKFMHDLLRNKKFRRALSYAIDRERINNVCWHGMGRIQNGTISEDSWHFKIPGGKEVFEKWANSWIEYNPQKANELLDEIGLSKRDEEGFRTRPDGSRLELVLDIMGYGARVDIMREAAAILKENWKRIGLRIALNDIAEAAIAGLRGQESIYQLQMEHTAEWDMWTAPDWLFPTGMDTGRRMWPYMVRWFKTGGKEGVAPQKGSVEERLIEIYRKGLREKDVIKRHHYIWDAIDIHIEEGPFLIGITGGLVTPILAKNNFRNVPKFGQLPTWYAGSPGSQNPEQFFFKR